jgi:hypothetical protein
MNTGNNICHRVLSVAGSGFSSTPMHRGATRAVGMIRLILREIADPRVPGLRQPTAHKQVTPTARAAFL